MRVRPVALRGQLPGGLERELAHVVRPKHGVKHSPSLRCASWFISLKARKLHVLQRRANIKAYYHGINM